MSHIPPTRPSGQQVTGQDVSALNNKPSVKGLATLISRSLPQPTNNNTNSSIVNAISSLPLPINYQPAQNDDLPPPDYLPPPLPDDVAVDTHAVGMDVLPKPITNSIPTIEITSPKTTDLRYSNKVNTNSPVVNTPVFDKQASERMQKLRDRADLGMTLPAISRDIQVEIEALAKKQGYKYDQHIKLYIKGKDVKTLKDFEVELSKETVSTADDEAAAKELELKLMLESKQKEAEQQEALTLQFLKDEDEKAIAFKQKEDAKNLAKAMLIADDKPASRPLSDDIIKEYEGNGWVLDDEGLFASHPNGEFKLYDAIKQEEDAKKLAKPVLVTDKKPASRPLSDEIIKELENSGWILDDEGQFASGPNGEFMFYDEVKKTFG